jgi:hypothetical protein
MDERAVPCLAFRLITSPTQWVGLLLAPRPASSLAIGLALRPQMNINTTSHQEEHSPHLHAFPFCVVPAAVEARRER